MSDEEEARRARAAARANWPIRKVTLDHEDVDYDRLSPGERIGMMWPLTRDAWAFTGRALPQYARKDMPGRVIRRGDARS